jgi:hypothetical protein
MTPRLSWLLIICLFPVFAKAQKPSFNRNIGALLYQKCSSCHREGGGAPFELSTFQQFAKRKKFVAAVVQSGYMPPWTADTHFRSFANQTALSEAEKQLILNWVATGAKEGRRFAAPALPDFDQPTALGAPDLVLQMPTPYTVPGNGQHHYIAYKIPFELPGDAYVKAVEFVPGNKALVHHASYQLFGTGAGTAAETSPDYYVFNTDSMVGIADERDFRIFQLYDSLGKAPFSVFSNGYLPGATVQQYPAGIGFALPRKGVLLIRSLHYSPTPLPRSDQSSLRLWFSDQPATRTIQFAAFKPRIAGDTIPAGEVRTYHINLKTTGDMSLLHINPHMHQLGKSFVAWAISPAGDTIPLVKIPQWDFNWQEFYRYERLLHIPSGSVIHAEAVYDNTANNPANPNQPPQPMLIETGSMDDTTEMMRLVFLYVPYQAGDELLQTD